jgi:hypothetical protein
MSEPGRRPANPLPFTDPLLDAFVGSINEHPLHSLAVWVLVPGGLLTGDLVSQRRALAEWEENTLAFTTDDPSQAQYPFSEGMLSGPLSMTDAVFCMHLLNARYFAGGVPAGVPMLLPVVRIRTDLVSAWGFGRIDLHQPPG